MSIITSQLPDVTWPLDTPITSYLLEESLKEPERTAFVDGPSGRSLSYGELFEAIQRFGGGLLERGAEKGEVLALVAPNIPEYAVVFHGTLYAGGTVTTINPTYTAKEIIKQLEDSKATRLVSVSLFEPVLKEVQEACALKEIILIDGTDANTQNLGAVAMSEYLKTDPLQEHIEIDPASHIACLPYSSGTTGMPKGVMLSHINLVANTAQADPMTDIGKDDVIIAVLPFFHIYGLQIIMNCSLRVGAKVITQSRFDLGDFLACVQEHKATRLYLVPPIILALAKHPIVDEFDLSSVQLITSGAAPLSGEVEDLARKRIDAEILQGYGMTELSPLSHAGLIGKAKAGSAGVLCPNTECRIVDVDMDADAGALKDMPAGETGELLIRGPQVMVGYLNNPAATEEMLDKDGWLHTGDVGYVDEDGNFYIVDRSKELIKYKGFQVSPAELEGILLTHPAVADAAVIGMPDEEAGEVPKAFIALKEGQNASEQEIIDFAAEDVATFKRIQEVAFVDEIPKSATGKILRRLLRDN